MIPEDECVGFTSLLPALAPTKPNLYVCGVSFEDVPSKCQSEEDACNDVTDTTAYCAVTDADVTRSCFVIPQESCPTDAPSSLPMASVASALPT